MTYSRTQVILHWIVVVLIAVQFIYPDGMSAAWRLFRKTGESDPGPGAYLHIVFGATILVFMLWRLALRLTKGVPPQPAGDPAWQRIAAAVTHWGLYVVLILTPVSGSVAWFLGAEAAGEAHEVMTSVIYVLVGLHIAAALYHQFVQKDGLMSRMTLRSR